MEPEKGPRRGNGAFAGHQNGRCLGRLGRRCGATADGLDLSGMLEARIPNSGERIKIRERGKRGISFLRRNEMQCWGETRECSVLQNRRIELKGQKKKKLNFDFWENLSHRGKL